MEIASSSDDGSWTGRSRIGTHRRSMLSGGATPRRRRAASRRRRRRRRVRRTGRGRQLGGSPSPSSGRGAAPSRSRSWRWSRRGRTATGNDVKYTGTRDINTVLTTGVASGILPDLAGLPGPGQMTEFAKAGALKPLDDVLDIADLQGRDRARARRARHGRRQDLRRLHQGRGQGPDLVQPEGLRPAASAGDLGRPHRPAAPATGRQALVHRARVRRRVRLARHRLDRGHRPPPERARRLRRLGRRARRSGPRPRSSRRSRPSARPSPTRYGGSDTVLTHELRRRRQPAVHRPARLPVPPSGQLHHRLLQEPGRRRRTAQLRLLPDARHQLRSTRAPSTGAGDLFGMFNDTPQAKRPDGLPRHREAQEIWVERGGALSANKNVTELPGRHRQALGGAPGQCQGLPRSTPPT